MRKILIVLLSFFIMTAVCYAEQTEEKPSSTTNIDSARFVYLLSDSSFDYFFDSKTIVYNSHPYLDEQVVDVWIKEINNDEFQTDTGYEMKHYYYRINDKQMMLLEYANFTTDGRLIEKSAKIFTDARWENIIPATSEEKCYQLILDYAKNNKISKINIKQKKQQQDIYDILSTIII